MTPRRVVAAVCASAVLVGVSAAAASEADVPQGTGVVFSVFENLPPNGACPGLYAVDARTREISWLGGWDAQRDDFANYPQFTAGSTLSYAHFVDPNASGAPSADVYAGTRVIARASWPSWAWSPRREELAFPRLAGRRLELVLTSATVSTRVLARSSVPGVSWLPDGGGLVYGRRSGTTYIITFVRRDGRGRKDLARSAVMPLVSPDGRQVAFVRERSPRPPELWVVGSSGGRARRVLPGSPLPENLLPMTWLSNREILVQRGGKRRDPHFDARDTVLRVNVATGRTRVFLRRAFALSVSPDRRHVLFVRAQNTDTDTYYSIRTVRVDGTGERLLAVTDEEDLNVGSRPVWKPAGVQLGPVGDQPMPNAPSEAACVARLTALRARTP